VSRSTASNQRPIGQNMGLIKIWIVSLILIGILATKVEAQLPNTKLIVVTSDPRVSVIVNKRFQGKKNTRTHIFQWALQHGFLYEILIEAVFEEKTKSTKVKLKCGDTHKITFDFENGALPPIIDTKPDISLKVEGPLRVDPLKVESPLRVDPLKVESPLRVDPLKVEMEPLEIIVSTPSNYQLEILYIVICICFCICIVILLMLTIGKFQYKKQIDLEPPEAGQLDIE
jgi:hypothetical protein